MHDLFLDAADATESLGARLAQSLPPRGVAYLHGDLGAGKSTLARALLRALGVTGTIRSPTYTLVEQYPLPAGGMALHLDLYRIGDPGELEFLGLDPAETRLWLVEWPERGQGGLPAADVDVELTVEGTGRRCRLHARTTAGEAWLQALRPA
ncbi:tRNA (adenosine(37)-N6)-threonylcarbamoyltransferase complex ATPase subunit type 1 TsaE [Thermomonas carbonis]|uniref:tRNA threonylcarbamoyladenosine biosynthesis protein TsaE n=1 Tax=Thermomonas carbonis TaxID=1463158 RepID=A0A7G9SQ52_9GAMM|nr:tRNA (adenosine(37)-N6)-threonylcarbamoyltransferase complex ATPase subunit type 1 TsaE [Thermomonas carbonis]QNN69977.1 tRNA (adenosine(37)-N6)-threonylcarbamoyltransferase complex ATPase subunit type 1 TsaE [Thermomonas carbonis]GHB96787.1 tRNA (adenosine(37)-N6)-threonylcarbamoyltransferase complex ATPase subunit type 1 TsaE [Thermomonas carbonis]